MKRPRTRWFLVAGLLLSLLLAGVVSNLASSDPDGLEAVSRRGCEYSGDRVVGGECLARSADRHEVGGPLADYGVAGIDNPYLSTGLAGVIGVLVVFGIGAGVFHLARRRGDTPAHRTPAPPGTTPPRS